MGKLTGRVAIITGGARGQGAEHAKEFIQQGAKVVITDILESEGQALVNELGDNCKFIKHDVSQADEWENVVTKTEELFGPVNILVNNAGIVVMKSIEEQSEEEYRRVIDINQVSVYLGMK